MNNTHVVGKCLKSHAAIAAVKWSLGYLISAFDEYIVIVPYKKAILSQYVNTSKQGRFV